MLVNQNTFDAVTGTFQFCFIDFLLSRLFFLSLSLAAVSECARLRWSMCGGSGSAVIYLRCGFVVETRSGRLPHESSRSSGRRSARCLRSAGRPPHADEVTTAPRCHPHTQVHQLRFSRVVQLTRMQTAKGSDPAKPPSGRIFRPLRCRLRGRVRCSARVRTAGWQTSGETSLGEDAHVDLNER